MVLFRPRDPVHVAPEKAAGLSEDGVELSLCPQLSFVQCLQFYTSKDGCRYCEGTCIPPMCVRKIAQLKNPGVWGKDAVMKSLNRAHFLALKALVFTMEDERRLKISEEQQSLRQCTTTLHKMWGLSFNFAKFGSAKRCDAMFGNVKQLQLHFERFSSVKALDLCLFTERQLGIKCVAFRGTRPENVMGFFTILLHPICDSYFGWTCLR